MSRKFSIEAVISLMGGQLWCPFIDMHELCNHLAGTSLFTAALANRALWDKLRGRAIANHPQLRELHGREWDSVEAFQADLPELKERFGDFVEFPIVFGTAASPAGA